MRGRKSLRALQGTADPRLLKGLVAGAASTVGAWVVLEWVARKSVMAAPGAGVLVHGAASPMAARYAGTLIFAGLLSGLFGGLVSGVVARPGTRMQALVLGAFVPTLAAIVSWIGFWFWHVPEMGESARLWVIPLILCGAAGGWLAIFLLRPVEVADPDYYRDASG